MVKGDEVAHGFLNQHERGWLAKRQDEVAETSTHTGAEIEYAAGAGVPPHLKGRHGALAIGEVCSLAAVPMGVAPIAQNRRDANLIWRIGMQATRVQGGWRGTTPDAFLT